MTCPSTAQPPQNVGSHNGYVPYTGNSAAISSSPQPNNKRKRGDNGLYQKTPQASIPTQTVPPNAKPQRAKVATAPAVPSFGFTLPTVAPAVPQPADAKKEGEKKRKKIQLGLTGKEVDMDDTKSVGEQEENDEGIDEEAELALKMGVQGMAFEHNGMQISLQTPAEITAWLRDRRKEYPTRQRVAEKAQEAAERRAKELEFLHKVQGGKTVKKEPPDSSIVSTPATVVPQSSSGTKAEILQELRAKVENSRPGKQKPSDPSNPTAVDLGLGYASDSASESGYSILDEESSAVSSSSEDSDESSDDTDSDSGPETQSSKVEVPAIVVPPPAPAHAPAPPPTPAQTSLNVEKNEERRICSSWRNNGSCRYGKHCRYAHPPKTKEKRMGLYERLVEQEKDKADRLALDAIKWLGRNGFLG
ncbi:uncharacterized protein EI97DRAFT_449662 [Westerdykella ornata]|uniref:C3H1-type domain-containing protein n=1 Tax=Westerdykella ornata TaxID=318751 RepID=A0A6A6JMW1_WESOR|nr:uncharacterized protein EI97DRAFT_449662 [Westerdykella ornata]KAF2277574.1 hypothetical protein EI97DRAFT_449662 [Westerdykella ornata]